ncbi:MAG: tetratricopeptide repeat protein [Ferruginibacter sp.]
MRPVFIFCLILYPFLFALPQDVSSLIKEGDRLESIPDEKAAFHKFREVLKLQPLNIYAVNKCSELCSRIGQRQTDPKVRDDYYHAAKTYAGLALKINPHNSEANCLMGMVLGRSSMTRSGKEKIQNAREIKKYVDLSIKFDARNFKAWHILGRWHYEITNLNFIEKAAVKVLYGGVPAASLKESIHAFEKVRAIVPGFILNYLEMAKAYMQNGQKEKAIAYLNVMLSLPIQTEDDAAIQQQGRKLLKEWR